MSVPVVQAVSRAFLLLEQLAERGGEASLADLAAAAGLAQPTVHRLLRTLTAGGYVCQLPSRRYVLGPALVGLGVSAGKQLGAAAARHLDRAAIDLGETVNLAVMDSDSMVYVAQAQAPSRRDSMRTFTEVGRRVPCHSSGVGKAALSVLPVQAVRELISRVGMPPATARSITDVDALLGELQTIRQAGYAIDEEEHEIGVRCVAVPLPGPGRAGAVSVSGPTARLGLASAEAAANRLQEVARRIAAES